MSLKLRHVIFAVCVSLVANSMGYSTVQDRANREKSLKKFLEHFVDGPTDKDKNTRDSVAFVDLRDDGTQQVIVYLISRDWCGSGGCSCFILQPQGSSFRIITRTTVTQLPIRVLSAKTNGWHDLGVGVGGGGNLEGYEARLRFNGRKYPSNPSVSPAQKLRNAPEGKIVIPDNARGTLLYSD
jgi:hypothetical protein